MQVLVIAVLNVLDSKEKIDKEKIEQDLRNTLNSDKQHCFKLEVIYSIEEQNKVSED